MTDGWSCLDAADCVLFVSETLRKSGLVPSWVFPDSLGDVVHPCAQCNAKDPKPKGCTGWELTLEVRPVSFRAAEIDDMLVNVECRGMFSLRRAQAQDMEEWEAGPFAQCSASVIVRYSDAAVARAHLDLANPEQAGPVWHLQLGGGRGAIGKQYERPATFLRWPAAPMDFLLLVELVLFNFFWEEWMQIRDMAAWQYWVKRSEDLAMTHYWDHVTTYHNLRSSYVSWLAAQDNKSSGWDPRAP